MLQTPMVELLSYVELQNEKDKASAHEKDSERYLAFLSAFYASGNVDSKEREEFRQSLLPRSLKDQPIEKREWNFELLKRLKLRQKGG
ncbi:hypothetical protein [Sporolactobacillus terrae]|uniref:hypothetical protein n=1 Tax=Sporolactobacillus terrae TaxID=269673 RepID=UPI001268178C|nr:hypothetical protein [Sporolactobacillus terrae]